jgi:N-acetylmuramic acid 6-phosphate etherase
VQTQIATPTQHTDRKNFRFEDKNAGIEWARMFHDSAAMESPKQDRTRRILGVEGGGTKTDWVLMDESGTVLKEGQLPAANLKLSTEDQLLQLFRVLPQDVTDAGVFLAGCLTEADHAQVRRLAETVWPKAKVTVGGDRESGFATALGDSDGILVISGTGAVVHGRKGNTVVKAGGWGQLLGDRGSGYDLSREALRRVMLDFDLTAQLSPLATAILSELGLNELPQLVDWVNHAEKRQIARLSPIVFRFAAQGDPAMLAAIEERARELAHFTAAVATRLQLESPEVRLFGGILAHEPAYEARYRHFLAERVPTARVQLCTQSGAYGAAQLAVAHDASLGTPLCNPAPTPVGAADSAELHAAVTEQTHPSAAELDTMSAPELVGLFVSEEKRVGAALATCEGALTDAVEIIAAALANGGRLFYVGAGTSGRLGVLDASEIPPTFGTDPELVQGIIAGGAPALMRAAEGAEDSTESGEAVIISRGVRQGDVVCGIAASGRTPFVLGALKRARAVGARTILLTCNPARKLAETRWDVEIDLPTGPEIVTGSTRLKAGTATKVALNILSTCAMIRLGRVRGGAMIDLRATNAKLRDRATRIVSAALDCEPERARRLLESNDWSIRRALETAGHQSTK